MNQSPHGHVKGLLPGSAAVHGLWAPHIVRKHVDTGKETSTSTSLTPLRREGDDTVFCTTEGLSDVPHAGTEASVCGELPQRGAGHRDPHRPGVSELLPREQLGEAPVQSSAEGRP